MIDYAADEAERAFKESSSAAERWAILALLVELDRIATDDLRALSRARGRALGAR